MVKINVKNINMLYLYIFVNFEFIMLKSLYNTILYVKLSVLKFCELFFILTKLLLKFG